MPLSPLLSPFPTFHTYFHTNHEIQPLTYSPAGLTRPAETQPPGGGRLHRKRPAALGCPSTGLSSGTVLPVLGYCINEKVDGTPYCVRAYVPGRGTTFAGRQASRFRTALQREVWIGGIRPLFFSEINITDQAEALRLERVVEAVVIPMYDYRGLDSPMRKAA
jgi:hypothetical protein